MLERDNVQYYEDEIDLREIFAVLWRWKWIIIGVTVGFMVLAFLISKLLIAPVYQAEAVVAPANLSSLGSPSLTYVVGAEDSISWKMSEGMDAMLQVPQVSIQNFNALLTSHYVIDRSRQSLNLDQTTGEIRQRVEVKFDTNTNTTEVLVKGNDPEDNSRLANVLVEETILYLKEINQRNISTLVDNVNAQLSQAEKDLDEALTASSNGMPLTNSVSQNRIERDIKRREQMVDVLSSKLVELQLMQSYMQSQDQIIVLSPATESKAPVSPNVMLNTAIAGVLGFMLVIFTVFIIEYLRNDPKEKLSACPSVSSACRHY